MKRIILTIAIVLIGFASHSQELVGKVQHFDTYKTGGVYTFTYVDYKFQNVRDYKTFDLTEAEFIELYEVLTLGFVDCPKEPIIFESKQDVLRLLFSKSFGVVNLQIRHSVKKGEVLGVSKYLTSKAVKKVFGHKNR